MSGDNKKVDTTLNNSDILAIIRIIDVVSTRGAIQASEMKLVGDLYDKLKTIVESAKS